MKTDWEIDLNARTATHKKFGLIFKFGPPQSGWADGMCINLEKFPESEFENAARLAREAGEAFSEAINAPKNIQIKITIPPDINFSDLKLSRDPSTGEVEFEWAPIEKLCAFNELDINIYKKCHEDNVAGLIFAWYIEHLNAGGDRDPTQDQIIAEVRDEDMQN